MLTQEGGEEGLSQNFISGGRLCEKKFSLLCSLDEHLVTF
jgi:hypothetical protein